MRALDVLYPKVVDNQRERDGFFVVMPQAVGMGDRCVSIAIQVCCQTRVGKDTVMRYPIHAFSNFNDDPAIFLLT